ERDGSWHAWVQSTGESGPASSSLVAVRAGRVRPVEPPDAYRDVPRRMHGNGGPRPALVTAAEGPPAARWQTARRATSPSAPVSAARRGCSGWRGRDVTAIVHA